MIQHVSKIFYFNRIPWQCLYVPFCFKDEKETARSTEWRVRIGSDGSVGEQGIAELSSE